jgi:adenosylhomocysteinase
LFGQLVGASAICQLLDDEVAWFYRDKLGPLLSQMTDKQAAYFGVPKEEPFKPDHYRYYHDIGKF